MRFVKSHGLGNDYLVVDGTALPEPLAPSTIVRLCDRHRGVGADGVLVRTASRVADAGVRIVNPDGSEAEKSGNGLRIFAKWLVEHGGIGRPTFTVETAGGVVACTCDLVDGRVVAVTVEMGRASFRAADVPTTLAAGDAVEVPLEVAGTTLVVTAVSVGNPHCVAFVGAPSEAEVRRLGPAIERHPAFPARTNVQFARVEGPDRLHVLIWERGAGWTLASGSSSCAVAAAAVRTGRCPAGRIAVTMPGGRLWVDVRPDWSLRLAGPVEEVCVGTVSSEWLALGG